MSEETQEKSEKTQEVSVAIVTQKPAFLQELSKNTEVMNSLIKDVQNLATNLNGFEKSMAYGYYLNEIRNQFTGKALELIKNLMNTGLGFKTDRNPKDPMCKNKEPYSDDIIRDCATQAVMHGLYIHGNEFNILGGNFYATKEGLERIVNQNPNLERSVKEIGKGFKQNPENGIWGLSFEYEFKLKDRQEVKDSVVVYVRGKQGNYEIPFDAIMGKARRKLLKTIYNKMTNGFWLEDADDIDEIDSVKVLVDTGAKSKASQLGK